LNGNKDVVKIIDQYDNVYLPSIVIGELLFGAKNSSKRKDNELYFRQSIDSCEEIGVDKLVADEYSDMRLALKQKGRPIPENDIWIAAICNVNGIPLLTRDKHFSNIKSLKIKMF
jgi:tRNA(fMet)-specific endonuclease VapC